MNTTKLERDANLDLIKLIAIIATISIHVLAPGASIDKFSNTWYFFIYAGSFFRFCVPVFAMTTGYILYTREDITINKVLKNILKFIIYFILAETMYRFISYLYITYYYETNYSVEKLQKDLLNGNFKSHLYYIYIIIFIYAFAPICNLFVRKESGELKYLIILWILFSLILSPLIKLLDIKFLNQIRIYILQGAYNYLVFALLGASFRKYRERFIKINFAIYLFLFLILYFFISYLTIDLASKADEFYIWDSNNIFIFGLSFSIFAMLLKLKIKNRIIKKILALVSKCTFIIYVIHVVFTDYLDINKLNYTYFLWNENIKIALLELLGVFTISLIIAIILKSIIWTFKRLFKFA